MVQKIGQITNADLYLNGVDVKGRVKSFELDDFGSTEVDHEALGMIGVLKLPGRPVEALTAKINFDWLDEEVERALLNPTIRHQLQLHSYVDVFDETGLSAEKSHTLVTHVGFHVLKRANFSSNLGEMAGVDHNITVPAFSQKVYGAETPIVEFDVFASVYNVNGVPVWPR